MCFLLSFKVDLRGKQDGTKFTNQISGAFAGKFAIIQEYFPNLLLDAFI